MSALPNADINIMGSKSCWWLHTKSIRAFSGILSAPVTSTLTLVSFKSSGIVIFASFLNAAVCFGGLLTFVNATHTHTKARCKSTSPKKKAINSTGTSHHEYGCPKIPKKLLSTGKSTALKTR